MSIRPVAMNYKLPFPMAGPGVYIDPAVRYTHVFRLDCEECLWTAQTNDMTILAARNPARKLQCPCCGQWSVNVIITR